ncbi:serine--tRNA ligase [[Mycoplasma] mobile]|uniref:Serine--tRNA ligase n=1 Tax=Mycoplasma mobile (strain ATCC 43663 / 163K / NCTC 11711) TaxID=267748 RepID=SYS_MYCM1|nr:serine--tRNA ligase [[Mycoplasma] mobile]Q6KIJ8.1 RecName: Full=Serine--tRNA ligase; AltName: Full=Seryl-tRNA synthetase; Short=SerRS; AltName: Full=Seryl-tRNA(Ser/Sec) synthetase [Mycoplasma mobile 163K]AAT27578.1 seryl-tRNA synthetase [Mycoplasma mobile 163K]
MLDIKLILKNKDFVISKLKQRSNFNVSEIEKLYTLGTERANILISLSELQSKRNEISSKIGEAKRNKTDALFFMDEVENIKKELSILEEKSTKIENKIQELISFIPNIPLDDVPFGKDDTDNVILKEFPKIGRGLVKAKKPHYEIGVEKDLIDFSRGAKLSGSRFIVYKNAGAKLIRALESFMLDTHEKNGYSEIMPPFLVNSKMMYGTGQLPKFKEDLFKIEGHDLYLIPTAEVPVTNLFNNEIIDLEKNSKFSSFTNCFRSEAGSAGRDTKGIIRLHQFNKVELVEFASEQKSLRAFNSVLKNAKYLLELLEIPYREVLLCTGDLGFSSRKTIDLELWLPSEQRYREVSSVSYFGDFQSRRSMIRYRDENKNTQYVHTINGSGLAIDRVLAAILEQYQNDDGSISVPKVLIPYLNVEKI